jgi:hypothetical protein
MRCLRRTRQRTLLCRPRRLQRCTLPLRCTRFRPSTGQLLCRPLHATLAAVKLVHSLVGFTSMQLQRKSIQEQTEMQVKHWADVLQSDLCRVICVATRSFDQNHAGPLSGCQAHKLDSTNERHLLSHSDQDSDQVFLAARQAGPGARWDRTACIRCAELRSTSFRAGLAGSVGVTSFLSVACVTVGALRGCCAGCKYHPQLSAFTLSCGLFK